LLLGGGVFLVTLASVVTSVDSWETLRSEGSRVVLGVLCAAGCAGLGFALMVAGSMPRPDREHPSDREMRELEEGHPGQVVVKVRCRECRALNDEFASRCSSCSQAL
jgi:hypothetical protein